MQTYAGGSVSAGKQRYTAGDTAGLIGVIIGILGLFMIGIYYGIGITFGLTAIAMGVIALVMGPKSLGAAALSLGLIDVILALTIMIRLMSILVI